MTPQTRFDLWRERGDDPSRQIDNQWKERAISEYFRNQARLIDFKGRVEALR